MRGGENWGVMFSHFTWGVRRHWKGEGKRRRGEGRREEGGGEGRRSLLSRPTFQLVPTPLVGFVFVNTL